MKKVVALVLALMMLCIGTCMAAGELTVTKENYTVVESYGNYIAYLFYELTNTGDEPIYFGEGAFELQDADGNAVVLGNIYSVYPDVIQPGEKAFAYEYEWLDDGVTGENVPNYKLTVLGEEVPSWVNAPIQFATVDATITEGDYYGEKIYYVDAFVTNETEETQFDPWVAIALYDAEENLLYVDYACCYDVGIPAGQTIAVRFKVDTEFTAIWDAMEIVPASAAVISFVKVF